MPAFLARVKQLCPGFGIWMCAVILQAMTGWQNVSLVTHAEYLIYDEFNIQQYTMFIGSDQRQNMIGLRSKLPYFVMRWIGQWHTFRNRHGFGSIEKTLLGRRILGMVAMLPDKLQCGTALRSRHIPNSY
jgi:hypothetical protein